MRAHMCAHGDGCITALLHGLIVMLITLRPWLCSETYIYFVRGCWDSVRPHRLLGTLFGFGMGSGSETAVENSAAEK